jgi:hypothetical protein
VAPAIASANTLQKVAACEVRYVILTPPHEPQRGFEHDLLSVLLSPSLLFMLKIVNTLMEFLDRLSAVGSGPTSFSDRDLLKLQTPTPAAAGMGRSAKAQIQCFRRISCRPAPLLKRLAKSIFGETHTRRRLCA